MRHLPRKVLALVGLAALTTGASVAGFNVNPAAADPVADIQELRAAIDEANADPGAETIDLVAGVTYAIAEDECGDALDSDDDANETGDLDVHTFNPNDQNSQDLTIQTPTGAPAIILVSCDDPEVAGDQQRAIEAFAPSIIGPAPQDTVGLGTLTLRNVVIRNGHAPEDFADFGTDSFGGGVFAHGANLVLENVTLDGNRVSDGDDGIPFQSSFGENGGNGGAVAVIVGDLIVSGSTFTGNRAGHGGDGTDGACPDGTIFPGGGGAGGHGGAIWFIQGGSGFFMTVDTSTFDGNAAGDGGDGGDGQPPECGSGDGFFGSFAGSGGTGGAISVASEVFTIEHSLFTNNTAGDGGRGGDGGDGRLVDEVAVDDVSTQARGGNGAEGSDGGQGGDGGAVHVSGSFGDNQAEPTPERLIENSTFDSNTSGNGGPGGDGGDGALGTNEDPDGFAGDGGLGGCGGRGGAVAESVFRVPDDDFCEFEEINKDDVGAEQVEGALDLVHDTITENGGGGAGGTGGNPGGGAGDPPGGENGENGGGSLLTASLAATGIVVAESSGGTPDCWLLPLFADSNFSTDESCGFGDGSVQPFSAYNFSALGDHGGPTATRLPGIGSVLRNVIAAGDCTVDDDQRLFARPSGPGCEVGAVEVSEPVTLAVTKTASAASVPVGTVVTFTITVKNTGTGTPQPGVLLTETNCSKPENLTGGDANSNGTLDPGETWTYTCTATPPAVGTFSNTVTATVTDTDNITVSAQATATVNVVAAQELARTGSEITQLTRQGVLMIVAGLLLLFFAPLPGRHVRRGRWARRTN